MGRKRKTFDIVELIHTVNKRNASSTCFPELRYGWNSLLENVLREANFYNGYGYLEQKSLLDFASNSKPGIEFREIPKNTLISARKFFDALTEENASRKREGKPGINTPSGKARFYPDESRRFYYVDRSVCVAYAELEAQDAVDREKKDRAIRRNTYAEAR